MADKKISALPAATTPLTGAEVLPVVQSGVTDQVTVANLTVGRDIGTKAITTTGNVGVKCTPLSITPLQVYLGADRRLSTFLNGSDNVLGFLTDVGNWTSTFYTGTPAIFGNGATEAFRIGTDQNIAIKTSGKGITTGSAIPLGFGVNGAVTAITIDTASNVGIGTASPAATAILDVQSTTKGVRFPNMTTTQKTAITPSAGTVVFDTTLAKLCVYSGAAWQTITSI